MMKSFEKPASAPKADAADDSKPPVSKKKGGKPEDAKEIAGFLLSLKNQRSVSPDGNDSQPPPNEEQPEGGSAGEGTPAAEHQNPPVMVPYGAPVMPYPYAHYGYPGPYPTPMGYGHPPPPPPPHHPHHHQHGIPPNTTTDGGAPVTTAAAVAAAVAAAAAANTPVSAKQGKKAKKPRTPKPIPDFALNPDEAANTMEQFKEYDFAQLIEGSSLVQLKDRDLVPDPLYVAMSQMKHCHLTQSDRVGCYKGRDLDFIGMCCKHCGGQPGFGRYFPNSLRSLAQTTTSQTILKHIGSKCRFCPPEIRNAVLDLQRQQQIRESMATGRPRYGSRKIFFQRVWSRLHGGTMGKDFLDEDGMDGGDLDGIDDAMLPSGGAAGEEDGGEKSDDTASLEEEHMSLAGGSNAASLTETPVVSSEEAPLDEEGGAVGAAEEAETDDKGFKRKSSRFGALPTMKRAKVTEVMEV